MAKSIEEKVEDFYKNKLSGLGVRIYSKNEPMRYDIDKALAESVSKSGGDGGNFPDIKFILENSQGETLPVFLEAKGSKGKLEKISSKGLIEQIVKKAGQDNYGAIKSYAVNGAVHYGLAVLGEESVGEVLVIGINGYGVQSDGSVEHVEYKCYYISKKNKKVPKEVVLDDGWDCFKKNNVDKFFDRVRQLNLTEDEIRVNEEKAESELEERIHAIHQKLYDDGRLKTPLSTNEKLYLFCGLIMAGLKAPGMSPLLASDLHSDDNWSTSDGKLIMSRIEGFLDKKDTPKEKAEMISRLLSSVFSKRVLWKPDNGVSVLKELFSDVQNDIIPLLESEWHLDFTGKILNRLSDWVNIDNDAQNDVVLTPRNVTHLMARLARTDMDSFVWDKCVGSGGFLISAMNIMIEDAKDKITDSDELAKKIEKIKKEQLLGVEILGNIYILAVLNMILMGDGSSKILNEDSHKNLKEYEDFPATVFLLNPPYSAPGKGLNFVDETLQQMTEGYACILIQENAGSGAGLPYAKNILKNNSLKASIKMPMDVFSGKASVSTSIFLFKVGEPHDEDNEVLFIDMSNDGYTRQNRKKSNQQVNLRDTDDAKGRYEEVIARVLGKKPKTDYYTEQNGLLIRDTISLSGDDWCYSQHCHTEKQPDKDNFLDTVGEHLTFKVAQVLDRKGC